MWKFLLLALILAIWAYRKGRKHGASERPDLIDVTVLSKAEEEVATWPSHTDWQIVEKYETASGYTEADMAEIVTYLGSKGLKATFIKTGVGIEGGAITTFVLKVAPDDVEWAKQLLSEKDA